MGNRKVRVGRVVSNKMEKTVVVAVEWRKVHPLYGKQVRRLTRFKAHDERNACQVGDVVRIVETRPLSRDKRWRVVETLDAKGAPIAAPSLEEELEVAVESATAAWDREEGEAPEDSEGEEARTEAKEEAP